MPDGTCIESGCELPIRSRERCRRHYNQWIRTTPKDQRVRPALRERILAKVAVDSRGCWRWQGFLNNKGYGQVRGQSGTQMVHVATYEEWIGPIPDGLTVDHLCRVRDCCNPKHLEPVTHQVNLLRGDTVTARHAAKTHCPQGHPYSGVNLIIRQRAPGRTGRECRACRDQRNRARYE